MLRRIDYRRLVFWQCSLLQLVLAIVGGAVIAGLTIVVMRYVR